MKIISHQRWRWLAIWIVLQSTGILGIALNWTNRPAYLLWSGITLAMITLTGLAILLLPPTRLLTLQRRWRLHPVWVLLVAAALLILWALPLAPQYPLDALRWALTTLTAGLLALLVRGHVRESTWWWGGAILLGCMMVFSLSTLMIYPRIYTDEGWLLNLAWSSAAMGPLRYYPSFHLGIHGKPQLLSASPHLWLVGQWLRLVGLGLWQGRLAMWFFMPVTVFFAYKAGRTLYENRRAGQWAALFTAGSVLMLYIAHFIRNEVILCAALAAGLYLHALVERKQRWQEAFGLGLLLSLAVFIHTNAFVFCFAFGVIYLGRAVWELWQTRRFVPDWRLIGLAAGGITGGLLFAAIYILPNPTAFQEQYQYYFTLNYDETAITLRAVLQDRLLTTINHLRSWFAFSLVEASLLFFISLWAAIWRKRISRFLVGLLALCITGFFIVGGRQAPTYITILLPVATVLVGGLLVEFPLHAERTLAVGLMLLAAVWGSSIRQVIIAQQEGYNRQMLACLSALEATLPEDNMILGEHLYWLARPRPTGYATRTLVEQPWPTRPPAEWWAWINPDIVLWPGPIDPVGYEYVSKRGFTYYELPECRTSDLMIWLRPGIKLHGEAVQPPDMPPPNIPPPDMQPPDMQPLDM